MPGLLPCRQRGGLDRAHVAHEPLDHSVIGLGAAILVSWRFISIPIRSITGTMNQLAGGDMTVVIPFAAWRDEVGNMARAVEVFAQNMRRKQELQAEAARDQTANAGP